MGYTLSLHSVPISAPTRPQTFLSPTPKLASVHSHRNGFHLIADCSCIQQIQFVGSESIKFVVGRTGYNKFRILMGPVCISSLSCAKCSVQYISHLNLLRAQKLPLKIPPLFRACPDLGITSFSVNRSQGHTKYNICCLQYPNSPIEFDASSLEVSGAMSRKLS